MERLDEDVWRIGKAVTLTRIDAALRDVLPPSDSALLVYPYGRTKAGASAMRPRVYNG